MPSLFHNHKATSLAWLALVYSTGIGWTLGHSSHVGIELASAGVVITAFVKVWIIGFQFMELRTAPHWLHRAFTAWLLTTALIIIICLQ